MGCSSQPEHSCICHYAHLQLLHLPLKHLLPEFMESMTRFSDWNRAGAPLLFLNFNNVLAAFSKPFYLKSHFPCHTSTFVCSSGLKSLSAETAVLWHHVLSTFSSSIHMFPALLPHPATPVPPSPELSICSFYLFLSCTSALQVLPCFLNFCLLQVPHVPAKTLWKSCCIFRVPLDFPLPQSHIPQCVLPKCPTLLWHCAVSSMTKLACDSPQISRGEEVPVKGSWDFPE